MCIFNGISAVIVCEVVKGSVQWEEISAKILPIPCSYIFRSFRQSGEIEEEKIYYTNQCFKGIYFNHSRYEYAYTNPRLQSKKIYDINQCVKGVYRGGGGQQILKVLEYPKGFGAGSKRFWSNRNIYFVEIPIPLCHNKGYLMNLYTKEMFCFCF